MTTVQALRRIAGNMRLFPTLTFITFVVGIAEFAETAVLFDLRRAVLASVIETIVFLVILRAVAGNETVFLRLQNLADRIYNFGAIAPEANSVDTGTSYEEEATTTDYSEEEEPEEESEEEDEGYPQTGTKCSDLNCETCYPKTGESNDAS